MKLLLSSDGTYLYLLDQDNYTLAHAVTRYQITCPLVSDLRRSSKSLAAHIAESPQAKRPKDNRQ